MLGSLWVPRGKKTPFNNRLIRMERTSWFERLQQANLLLALALNPRQAEHKRRIICHWRDLLHFG